MLPRLSPRLNSITHTSRLCSLDDIKRGFVVEPTYDDDQENRKGQNLTTPDRLFTLTNSLRCFAVPQIWPGSSVGRAAD